MSDIHIHNTNKHVVYREQFKKLYEIIKKNNINIVTIIGDLFENYVDLSNESKILAGEFLNRLSEICDEVIVVPGNHDIRKKNLNRVDSIKTIVKLINNKKVTYFNKSDFFKDKLFDIVWVNHSHIEKQINPWFDITHNIIKDNFYIDLFHDPVYGSSTDTGSVFKSSKLKTTKDFKGDITLLGDIHKHQALDNKKRVVYPSSLIQQDFGESLEHGCVIWTLKSKNDISWEFINIPNDYTFVNLYIDEDVDYDNLNLNSPSSKYMDIKVHWKDYSSNITTENEIKIRNYITNKFNTQKIKFDKTYIYTDIASSKMLSESLDLSDINIQTEIFNEYLKDQKYKELDIIEIMKIDEIINSRLTINKKRTNITWCIDKFWFSNFKSYGDDNIVDWKNEDGIYQIHGVNKQGKTTILDAITYILYGKTTTTLSSEKHGDNRYINNKRDLDYCMGGAVIDIDGEKYTIQRRTERKWNRTKTGLSSCSTTLEYYNDENISDDNKMTDEVETKTQKLIDLVLGEFKDFIRLSFTNADNLNDTLSQNRSVFMDNIIRDAGYDIFELKLDEFKKYKKELSEEKLLVDVTHSKELIKELNNDAKDIKNKIVANLSEIKTFDKELEINNENRDNLNKKLNDIDLSLMTFDEELNLTSIKNYNSKIKEHEIQGVILDREIEKLPSEFNSDKLDKLKIDLKKTNLKISERKDEISTISNLITESETKKERVLTKIEQFKESEIKKLLSEINSNNLKIQVIKNDKNEIINNYLRELTSKIQKIELDKKEKSNEIKLLQKDGLVYKKSNEELDVEIEDLEDSTSCPTCGREYDKNDPKFEEHLNHLNDKILSLKIKKNNNDKKIADLVDKYKLMKPMLSEFDVNISEIEDEKSEIKKGVFNDKIKTELKKIGSVKLIKQENILLNNKIDSINNNIFEGLDELKDKIEKGKKLLNTIEKEKIDNQKVIINLRSEISSFNLDGIEHDVSIEEKIKDSFELQKQKISKKENILLSIENFKFKIKELENEIKTYNDNKYKIDENKITQLSIDRINEKIIIIKDNIKEFTQDNINKEKDILLKEKEIENIKIKIKQYLKQKKTEELLKEYQKCVSRDGLPTYLLKKSRYLINNELNDLLSNVDFTLFLDDNLVLRMSSDGRLDVSQNAIESSGMERTFCSLSLKMALRQININSKCELIVMDEIMGKLIGDSIKEFIEFLDVIKSKVKKLIIIEHVHPINYDYLITVKKDDKLISNLELD